MLRGILGLLSFVLDLAGIFPGLAFNYLSLVLGLLGQAHYRLPRILRPTPSCTGRVSLIAA